MDSFSVEKQRFLQPSSLYVIGLKCKMLPGQTQKWIPSEFKTAVPTALLTVCNRVKIPNATCANSKMDSVSV
jgi:hypothetical protein